MELSEAEVSQRRLVRQRRQRQSRQRAQTLQTVAQAVSSTPDLKALLRLLVENIVKELDVERATIYLADERLETIADFVTFGVPEEHLPLLLALKGRRIAEFPIAEQLLGATGPIVIANARKSGLIPPALSEGLGMHATMFVPVRSKETPIAALSLDTSQARAFSRDELALAQAIADQAAVAIENARLYERLTASEAKYRSIFENAVVGIYRTTPEGRILAANLTMARILGYESVEEVLKSFAFDLYVDPADRLRWREELERQGVIETELQIQRCDGKRIWIHDLARVVRDPAGRVLYYEGTLEDITERKRAEERAAHQAQLLSQVKDAMIATDMETRITMWNREAERLYGWRAEQVLGKVITDVVPTRIEKITREQLRREVLEKGFWRGEVHRVSRDGREMVIDLALSLIKGAAGETIGVLGVNRDITEQKRVELERQVIFEIIQGIMTTANLDELLRLIHHSLKKVVYAENCFIALHHRDTGEFHFPYFVDQFDAPLPQRMGKSFTNHVFRTGHPFLGTPETCRRMREQGEIELMGTPSPSWLGVPLKTPSETIGVLVVQSYEREGVYSERDVEFLASVGAQVAMAIERKRAEEALRASERRYRLLFERNLAGVFRTSLDGRVLDCNESLARILGYDSREGMLESQTVEAYFDPADREAFISRLREQRTLTNFEVKLRRQDNTPIWVLENVSMVEERDGAPPVVQGTMVDITERKRAEEALRAESEFRRATIQRAAEGICVCHEIAEYPYVGFTIWNERMTEITGYTMDEINEKGWYQSVYPDPQIQAKAIERMVRMRLGEDLVAEEWEITRSDGQKRILSISTSVLQSDDGNHHVLALMHDITERKRAEEALRRSQQQYRSLVESVSDVVFSIDLDGRVTYVNPVIEQLSGYALMEVIGRHFTEFVYPEDLDLVQQILARRLQGDTRPGEFRMVAKNGDVHVVQSLGRYVMEGDKIVGFTGILRDVTEARRAEARLARIYDIVARYQGQELMDRAAMTLAELLGAPYVFIGEAEDSDGISFWANGELSSDQFTESHQRGRKAGRMMRALAFYSQGGIQHGELYDLHGTPCQRVIDEQRLYCYSRRLQEFFPEDPLLKEWGIESYIGAPITDSTGQVVGIINALDRRVREFTEAETRILQIVGQRIGTEIERRRREEAQAKLQEQLFQAQKMESVGTLAGGVAHDFNNLLTGIMGFTEMAALELGSVDPRSEHLEQVLSLSARARELVRQLLLFSRPAAEGRQVCRLHAFLGDIAALLRRTIPENVEIEQALAEEEVHVEVNPSQLQQVLLNLAVNARDAMADGGRLRIETMVVGVDPMMAQAHTNVQAGRFVRVSVSDTGEGIPAPILPHIFEPFFTTKEVGKGTGLGLSVAYGIVKAHGGWIEVESQVGQGTSFHIYLPLAETTGAEQSIEDEEGIIGGTETILIVEDEPTVRTLGRKVLEKLGYRVLIAQNGRQAVEVYAAYRDEIDLVLLDVIMPQMSGQRALEELRALNSQVKILLVTGYSPGDVTEDLVLRGAQGVVQKPYDMKTLATVVRQCLDNALGRAATPYQATPLSH